MGTSDRFQRVYKQGIATVTEIWVDKKTGVNYLYHSEGYLDKEGKTVISPLGYNQ